MEVGTCFGARFLPCPYLVAWTLFFTVSCTVPLSPDTFASFTLALLYRLLRRISKTVGLTRTLRGWYACVEVVQYKAGWTITAGYATLFTIPRFQLEIVQVLACSLAQGAAFLPHLVLSARFGASWEVPLVPPIYNDPFICTVMDIRSNGITQTRLSIVTATCIEHAVTDVLVGVDVVTASIERVFTEFPTSCFCVFFPLWVLGARFLMIVVCHVGTIEIVLPRITKRCGV